MQKKAVLTDNSCDGDYGIFFNRTLGWIKIFNWIWNILIWNTSTKVEWPKRTMKPRGMLDVFIHRHNIIAYRWLLGKCKYLNWRQQMFLPDKLKLIDQVRDVHVNKRAPSYRSHQTWDINLISSIIQTQWGPQCLYN